MKKYFAVSDVHGFYTELMTALDNAGFDKDNPNHIFVSCGDLFDRGTEAEKLLKFATETLNPDRAIFISGNHEQLLFSLLDAKRSSLTDQHNGTYDTICQLSKSVWFEDRCIEVIEREDFRDYARRLWWYYETSKYIFVHGWIPCEAQLTNRWESKLDVDYNHIYIPNWRDASAKDWDNATWTNGMCAWAQGVREPGKTIVCGHWHTSWGHDYLHNDPEIQESNDYYSVCKPFVDDGIIALDATTVYTHKVNCVVLEDDELSE